MLALVTQKETTNPYGEPADSLVHASLSYVRELGFTPLPVPNDLEAAREIARSVDYGFLLLTGGGFAPIEFFSNDCGDHVAQPNRDAVERLLVADAVEKDVPIMGLCRGMHMLNGIFGGTVTRNGSHSAPRHDHYVAFESGERALVNTFHNNAVARSELAEAFECLAVEEGTRNVECFRSREPRILGLQWHPERPMPSDEGVRISALLAAELLSKTTEG